MSAPASLVRVVAALVRNSPPWPSTAPDTDVGRELGSIGLAIAMLADQVDAVLDELFPDTTNRLIDRWEAVARVPSRPDDLITTRRARVLAVLRRVNGPQPARLAAALAPLLSVDPSAVVFLEQLRANIDAALTMTTGPITALLPTAAPGARFVLGSPWPGNVDDFGARVYLAVDTFVAPVVTLTHGDGTSWTFTPRSNAVFTHNRTGFLGHAAAGPWAVSVYDPAGGVHATEVRIEISNDVDSGQIYNFFVIRDPGLPGTADIAEAQRQFTRLALANMNAIVAERSAFVVDDPHSVVDRDPVGV
jgi:hypothetical protein